MHRELGDCAIKGYFPSRSSPPPLPPPPPPPPPPPGLQHEPPPRPVPRWLAALPPAGCPPECAGRGFRQYGTHSAAALHMLRGLHPCRAECRGWQPVRVVPLAPSPSPPRAHCHGCGLPQGACAIPCPVPVSTERPDAVAAREAAYAEAGSQRRSHAPLPLPPAHPGRRRTAPTQLSPNRRRVPSLVGLIPEGAAPRANAAAAGTAVDAVMRRSPNPSPSPSTNPNPNPSPNAHPNLNAYPNPNPSPSPNPSPNANPDPNPNHRGRRHGRPRCAMRRWAAEGRRSDCSGRIRRADPARLAGSTSSRSRRRGGRDRGAEVGSAGQGRQS